MKRKNHVLFTLLSAILFTGMSNACIIQAASPKTQAAVIEKEIIIPGISGEYTFAVVNDQHIIVPDDDILSEKKEDINQRHELFQSENGVYSSDLWQELPEQINTYEPDGVILNGDMIDYFSISNFENLQSGLEKITAPVMYLRADHDLGIWYHDNISKDTRRELEYSLDNFDKVMTQEFNDFMIVGINNNTSQISEKALEALKEIWKKEKPVILALHVPLKSQIDDSLSEASKESWGDRSLLWGNDCYYEPDEVTQEFLDMVFAEDSPVAAVLGAHLHFPFEDKLNENITQYTLEASYKGYITLFTVKGSD